MQIIFNPDDASDVNRVRALLGGMTTPADHQDPQVTAEAEPETVEPAPETTGETTEVATDVNGVPWMEEFHASSKSLNKDGTWRRRKGVDKNAADAAEKAARAPSTAPSMPGVEPTVDTPAMPDVPSMPSGPAAPPAPAPAPAPVKIVTYEELVAAYQAAAPKGLDVTEWYKAGGVPQLPDGKFDVSQLATNETLRARLMGVLRDNGLAA